MSDFQEQHYLAMVEREEGDTEYLEEQMQSEYTSLVEAQRTIAKAKFEVSKEDDHATSPAWVMLWHAHNYLQKLANLELRGE